MRYPDVLTQTTKNGKTEAQQYASAGKAERLENVERADLQRGDYQPLQASTRF